MTQQTLAPQMAFEGMEVDPYKDLSLKDMAALILDRYPETRDDDMGFILRCLWEFDGLHKVLDAETYRKLLAWAERQERNRFETWRRRRQEIQRNRTGAGYLKPSDEVAAYRKRRDGAGAPKRRA